MRRLLILIVLFSLTQPGFGQEKQPFTLKWGVNGEYSYSGSTNTIIAGPALFMEKGIDSESGLMHAFTLSAGVAWSRRTHSSPVISAGYFFGKVPGIVFGISSQQYFNIETIYNNTGTDVRLSGEVIFAVFGFLGYRYQQPLLMNSEALEVTRHSFFIRIPIPIKTIPGK